MSNGNRFGRRLPLPSTRQIIHELRLLESEGRIVELKKQLNESSSQEVQSGALPHASLLPSGARI